MVHVVAGQLVRLDRMERGRRRNLRRDRGVDQNTATAWGGVYLAGIRLVTRLLVAAVAACLLLLLWSRYGAPEAAEPPAPVAPVEVAPVVDPPDRAPGPPRELPAVEQLDSPGRTPVITRLARMEGRRRLQLSGGSTYLDSLWQAGDSTVRRWADGRNVGVAVVAQDPGQRSAVQAAFRAWNDLRVGVTFSAVADSAAADIVVEFIEQFPVDGSAVDGPGRTGLTAVRSAQTGEIRRARITLALLDAASVPLGPDQIRAIAMHEFGHALGLPHSGSRGDIMHEIVVAGRISDRDRASAALLYALPPGSLRDEAAP